MDQQVTMEQSHGQPSCLPAEQSAVRHGAEAAPSRFPLCAEYERHGRIQGGARKLGTGYHMGLGQHTVQFADPRD